MLPYCSGRPRGFHGGAALGRVLADQRIFVRGAHHLREVARGRDVGRRKAGRLDEAALVHVEHRGLGVHRVDEGFQAAGIALAERRGGAVLRGHEREQQQLAAREREAGAQARARALHLHRVVAAQGDLLVEVEAAVEHHHRGHQLGDRGDRHHGFGVLAVDDFAGFGVLHQRRGGAESDLADLWRGSPACAKPTLRASTKTSAHMATMPSSGCSLRCIRRIFSLDQRRPFCFVHALNGTWSCRSLIYAHKNLQAKQWLGTHF